MEGYHIIVFCVEHEHGTLDSWQPSEMIKNTFRLGVVKTLDSRQPSEINKNTFRLGVVKTLDSWQPSSKQKDIGLVMLSTKPYGHNSL